MPWELRAFGLKIFIHKFFNLQSDGCWQPNEKDLIGSKIIGFSYWAVQ